MDDLISRQAAIDALNEYFARIGKLKRRGLTEGEKAISLDTVGTIKTLPPAPPEPQWIPVSERLPETTDSVLTTYIVNGDRSRRYVEESAYYEDDEYWCSPWDEYRKAGTRIEVIAWMPLPKPFEGGIK